MADTERRRNRATISCTLCRKRKQRCNRERPCSNCLRSRGGICVYENPLSQPPRRQLDEAQNPRVSVSTESAQSTSIESKGPGRPLSSRVDGSTSASTLSSQLSAQDIESIKSKIRQLEEQLSNASPERIQLPAPVVSPNIEVVSSTLGGTFHIHHDDQAAGQPQATPRSVGHKTRFFGQSHWVNRATALCRDLFEAIEPHIRDGTSNTISSLQRCKSLARVIKSRQLPPWPTLPTPDLPPKHVTDELVDCYLRTTESIHRVLHVPTFRREYEALWVSDTKPPTAFLVQLKLVLAIGAVVYDEHCSLRTSAIRWVYEAQTWLAEPKFKSRLNIQSLQINILVLIARERLHAGGDPVWISAGSLFRIAVFMGLHKDPSHLANMTSFDAEMRRRLWNTILEILLQSSFAIGGPPFVSLDDFDTKPPNNLDDDQLVAEDPVPKPENEFTQVSIAIALRRTFPIRLAIAKFLNDQGSHCTYEETLRLDTELRASYKVLRRTLQGCSSDTRSAPSQFDISIVDFMMHRYLSSIHLPFFSLALHETAYAFSRKVVVENSLKIWRAAYPSSPIMGVPLHSNATTPSQDDLARLIICGAGLYRTAVVEACLLISVELKTQLQEEESLGPVPLRPDLLSVLEDAKSWALRCVQAGETNIKGYILASITAASIDGIMRCLGKDEISLLMIKAIEEAEEICLPILEQMVIHSQSEGSLEDLQQMSLNTTPGAIEDWDFMMADTVFNPEDMELNMDLMSSIFNNGMTEGPLWG